MDCAQVSNPTIAIVESVEISVQKAWYVVKGIVHVQVIWYYVTEYACLMMILETAGHAEISVHQIQFVVVESASPGEILSFN